MSIARGVVISTGLLLLGACVTRASSSSNGMFEWASRESAGTKECPNIEHYATPHREGSACVADVLITSKCNTASSTKSTFIAFPTDAERKDNCESLRVGRDFVSQSAYGGDTHFLPLLGLVSKQLHRDVLSPSESFKELGEQVVAELREVQMSAITGVHLAASSDADADRYRISFFLPRVRAVVSLELNIDGSNPEWARVVR